MTCLHLHAIAGLDAAYCHDCRQYFDVLSPTHQQILKRGQVSTQARVLEIRFPESKPIQTQLNLF